MPLGLPLIPEAQGIIRDLAREQATPERTIGKYGQPVALRVGQHIGLDLPG